jgi:hypothetical protein
MNTHVTLAKTAAISNTPDRGAYRKALFDRIETLGRESGTGATSLKRLAAELLIAASKGMVDWQAKKGKAAASTGSDDIEQAWKRYSSGHGKKAHYSSPTQQKSKLRAFPKAGDKLQKLGEDAEGEFNRWNAAWTKARKAESDAGATTTAYLPEYQALCACANAQNAADQNDVLDDDQIMKAITKPGKEEDDFASLIKQAHKKLEKAIALRPDDNAEDAARLLDKLLGFLAAEEEQAKAAEKEAEEAARFTAWAAQRGLVLAIAAE